MKRLISTALLTLALSAGASAQQRPPILGVAHIALKTNDLVAARDYYGKYLGFAEAFTIPNADGTPEVIYFKVNDRQYIEIFPGLKGETEDRLSHIAFETTNAEQLRAYLASRDVKVPAALRTLPDGNLSFVIHDPDGHAVEFVQYVADGPLGRAFGKFLPASRISEHIGHVGFTVSDRAAADRLFQDILGFHNVWQGGMKDDGPINWVDMRVPDGMDHLEYMLDVHNPTPRTLGVMNHLCLIVPNVAASYKTLLARDMKIGDPPKIGRDGKWQLNLYDPNLTRGELMEPKPVQKPCCSPMLDQ
jgi:catechol 2,3-dioxygenase-like lactoylglutathione lyase family enzyme